MNNTLVELHNNFPNLDVKENINLSSYNSFKSGGNCYGVISVTELNILVELIKFMNFNNINYRILGSGTNMVFSDKGFSGFIIKNNCRKFELLENGLLRVQSGSISNMASGYLMQNGLLGLEKLYGIPGTIGGALRNNANLPSINFLFQNYVYMVDILKKDNSIAQVDSKYFNFGPDYSILQDNEDVILQLYIITKKYDSEKVKSEYMTSLKYRKDTQPKNIVQGVVFRNINIDYSESSSYSMENFGIEKLFMQENYFSALNNKLYFYRDNPRYIMKNGVASADELKNFIDLVKDSTYKKYKIHLNIKDYLV